MSPFQSERPQNPSFPPHPPALRLDPPTGSPLCPDQCPTRVLNPPRWETCSQSSQSWALGGLPRGHLPKASCMWLECQLPHYPHGLFQKVHLLLSGFWPHSILRAFILPFSPSLLPRGAFPLIHTPLPPHLGSQLLGLLPVLIPALDHPGLPAHLILGDPPLSSLLLSTFQEGTQCSCPSKFWGCDPRLREQRWGTQPLSATSCEPSQLPDAKLQ